MSDILGAVIGGIASGLVGGALGGIYFERTRLSRKTVQRHIQASGPVANAGRDVMQVGHDMRENEHHQEVTLNLNTTDFRPESDVTDRPYLRAEARDTTDGEWVVLVNSGGAVAEDVRWSALSHAGVEQLASAAVQEIAPLGHTRLIRRSSGLGSITVSYAFQNGPERSTKSFVWDGD